MTKGKKEKITSKLFLFEALRFSIKEDHHIQLYCKLSSQHCYF